MKIQMILVVQPRVWLGLETMACVHVDLRVPCSMHACDWTVICGCVVSIPLDNTRAMLSMLLPIPLHVHYLHIFVLISPGIGGTWIFPSLISQLHGNLLQLESALAPFRDYVTLLRDTLQACHLHQVHNSHYMLYFTNPFLLAVYTLMYMVSNYCVSMHGYKL